MPYTSENVAEGKKAAKIALQRKLGLRVADYPLVGIISRLTVQKGIHLIKHAIHRTLERNGQVLKSSLNILFISSIFKKIAVNLTISYNFLKYRWFCWVRLLIIEFKMSL
jgi:glycogen synthase